MLNKIIKQMVELGYMRKRGDLELMDPGDTTHYKHHSRSRSAAAYYRLVSMTDQSRQYLCTAWWARVLLIRALMRREFAYRTRTTRLCRIVRVVPFKRDCSGRFKCNATRTPTAWHAGITSGIAAHSGSCRSYFTRSRRRTPNGLSSTEQRTYQSID